MHSHPYLLTFRGQERAQTAGVSWSRTTHLPGQTEPLFCLHRAPTGEGFQLRDHMGQNLRMVVVSKGDASASSYSLCDLSRVKVYAWVGQLNLLAHGLKVLDCGEYH